MKFFDVYLYTKDGFNLNNEHFDRLVLCTAFSATLAQKIAYLLSKVAEDGNEIQIFERESENGPTDLGNIGVLVDD